MLYKVNDVPTPPAADVDETPHVEESDNDWEDPWNPRDPYGYTIDSSDDDEGEGNNLGDDDD